MKKSEKKQSALRPSSCIFCDMKIESNSCKASGEVVWKEETFSFSRIAVATQYNTQKSRKLPLASCGLLFCRVMQPQKPLTSSPNSSVDRKVKDEQD